MIKLAESGHHSVAYSVGYWIGTILVYGLLLGIYFVPGLLDGFLRRRPASPAGGGGDSTGSGPGAVAVRCAT